MLRRALVFIPALIAATVVGRSFLLPESGLAFFWPAAGVLAWWGLVLRTRAEAWLATLATILVMTGMAIQGHYSMVTGFFLVLNNLAMLATPRIGTQLLIGKPLLNDLGRSRVSELRTVPEVSRFIVLGLVAACISAAFTALALALGDHPLAWEDTIAHVFRNVASYVVLAGPGLAYFSRRVDDRAPGTRWVASAFAATAVVAGIIFVAGLDVPLAYTLLLPLFWSSLRFPTWLAGIHAAFTWALTIALVRFTGAHPFGMESAGTALAVRLQLFAVIAGCAALLISSAIRESDRLAATLRSSEARALAQADYLETVAATVPEGLVVVGRDGSALPLNEAGRRFVVDSAGEQRHAGPTRGVDGRELAEAELPAGQALAGTNVSDLPLLGDGPGDDGRVYEVSARPLAVDTDEALVVYRDATSRYQAMAELRATRDEATHLAAHDALTGLTNRHGFDAVLAEHRRRHEADGVDAALLLMDLDNFKNVNDSLGHAAGDALLEQVARMLRSTLRSTDTVARLGGDEFAILLPRAGLGPGATVAQHIVDGVADVARAQGEAGRGVTASVGVVSLDAAHRAGTDPMALADMLMYDAKDAGRNRVVAVDDKGQTPPRRQQTLAIRQRIERALENGTLELHLQPVLDLATDEITAAEALVRLREGDRLVMPGEFMPLAEKTGLAVDIDAWVVNRAAEILGQLHRINPTFSLSCNVAGPSVDSERYQRALQRALEAHSIPRDRFVLEVTETTAVADIDRAREFCDRLRDRGLHLALDDFGAGFGSFFYLKHLDFRYLKIDGEFVAQIDRSEVDQAIVRSLVSVARDLGKRTIAEHVVDGSVLAKVRELGVDLAQGYGIGKPVPVDEFVARFLPGGAPGAPAISRGDA